MLEEKNIYYINGYKSQALIGISDYLTILLENKPEISRENFEIRMIKFALEDAIKEGIWKCLKNL